MARIGGFEPSPRLAVGVSGGADSLALALLLQGWVAARGGSLLALTVDHRLRPEAAAEAERVGTWLTAHGIPHGILHWEGDKPSAGIQEAARGARHRLLGERCRAEGILHLALAHHRDDQAETVLLRLSRGSGVDGLAGMAPVRAEGPVRLIRPCLDLSHERLAATCHAAGQDWIEDPSNRNPAYARARLRAVAGLLAGEGLDAGRLAATARRAGRARRALEESAATLLAEAAEIHPEGWIRLDPVPLFRAPAELGLRALGRCLAVVGGAAYGPRDEALERLHGEIGTALARGETPRARTLGGCRIQPRRGGLAIAREPDAAAERLPLAPGGSVWWDRRFTVSLASGPGQGGGREGLAVARLGGQGWRSALALRPELARLGSPESARSSLPALWSGDRLVGVPSLNLMAEEQALTAEALFTPAASLAGPAFSVVYGTDGIM
ncbi:tRNA lysidine(34) synthetase TilS [Azospirillum sp. SYSU D00513]|uniref:tRNA lysidine(34) synthetase TilS n=1 Tax=Azospirillum sp. SYSU D00513 TaxID=2812561 RepID=UPI001A961DD2|nr:tRNA lysidine(34) synthetase TilS [Azospirillum sp. SYSU D00513]